MPVGVHGRVLSGGRDAACFANLSASSLPRIPEWPGVQPIY
jgi:hypothetical protein